MMRKIKIPLFFWEIWIMLGFTFLKWHRPTGFDYGYVERTKNSCKYSIIKFRRDECGYIHKGIVLYNE